MSYRQTLPQLAGSLFLTDAGLETDLIFNHGLEIREFAAHTLLPEETGRTALEDYFGGFLALARDRQAGFILDSQTWKAHSHWAADLGQSEHDLRLANHAAISFIAGLRDRYQTSGHAIVLNGVVGPRGDAYHPEALLTADQAEDYHSQQLGWLAETDVDMVTAMTFTQADEAAGFVNAARKLDLPAVVSFTVETDGALPTGQALGDAIQATDAVTDQGAAYFMINCAHPEHFAHVLNDEPWLRRIRGLRCNASRCSHAELDEAETLDAGNPSELAGQNVEILRAMPWLNVFGGCCGSDLRHVTAIANQVALLSDEHHPDSLLCS